ncbi:DSBA-like thioredoxin domain-containing protein [Clohesyomyces aquaticus]|uniref:DSBA-like thioredoxin domain-containing protein n=1 Tax=Clohesyomyces aquaticus TaxID=1231657 RepID=A0A1Y1YDU1_9PLEO|nr:DSBA-like thioredoxin domain-containing protein [Clohesyomyces aquaticus]
MESPTLEFNYDISCPFAYIASTRVEALAERTSATLVWRPVLLGAIYRATAAPQGAAGSASDVFNPTKKAVTARSMQRTILRYKISYNPPPQHPRKTVNALRLLYHVPHKQRPALSKALFKAYWVEGRDVSNSEVLLSVARESGIKGAMMLTEAAFEDLVASQALESATADAIDRGAFGVPGFWLPEELHKDLNGETTRGRFYWGQDRMHFVEAALWCLKNGQELSAVPALKALMPRCVPQNKAIPRTKIEFWYDFSSPWAFLGWTQLERLQRTFGKDLEIEMKPFLLGALFRVIGAPNLPMTAVSKAKTIYMSRDHEDWVRFWNAVNVQEGSPDKSIDFHWADIFPIRTPTVLRCAIVEPRCVATLYRACWEKNANVSDDSVVADILNKAGYNGRDLIKRASAPAIKDRLRQLTAEAKAVGICGAPSYRVFRKQNNGTWENVGGIIWGQDETNVVEDLVAGWDDTAPQDCKAIQKGKL